ncbi:DUF1648 domain-containing protein [Kurthia huakuii]|uniref:DUF1648 domain-containing protein n=1 Tax=Kurthia huakuii TaxID=1421019 RepID=UPI00049566B5|nr:DUF1648 domain-containing protein [Kurthia huakuii]MBM7698605.1 hypothetical protein [Kurthia huakuii]
MRPKIQLAKTRSEKIANVIGYAALLFLLFFFFSKIMTLPAEIPLHYNGDTVDRYGSKWTTIIIVIIAIALHIGMTVLERKPHIHNYPARINEKNAAQFYRVSVQILNYTKNTTAVLMVFVTYDLLQLHAQVSPFFWVLLIMILLIPVWGFIKMQRIPD